MEDGVERPDSKISLDSLNCPNVVQAAERDLWGDVCRNQSVNAP